MSLRIAIHGAAGRMGQRLIALGAADSNLKIVAAIDAARHPRLGQDAGALAAINPIGVPLSDSLNVDADVLIDFSVPSAAEGILRQCVARGTPIVVATTGFDAAQKS